MTRRKASRATASTKIPTQLPTQSAWAKGPPQSKRPSALGQGVSVKDAIAVSRNNVGSVRPASVVFGSIDDASALLSSPASTPASASATVSSKRQPSKPSVLSPSNSGTTSNTATLTSSTPKPTINKADIAKLFQIPLLSLQPSSDSPSTRPPSLPPHHQPSSRVFLSSCKYPVDPYNQPQHPWDYTIPSPHMHQPPHQHGPHTPLPASPVVTNRRTTSIRIESEEAKRMREDALRKEQEKKAAEERTKKEAEEKKNRQEEEAGHEKRVEEERVHKEEEEREWVQKEEKGTWIESEEALRKEQKKGSVYGSSGVAPILGLPREIPQSRNSLDLALEKKDFSASLPSTLRITHAILNLSEVEYPEGIKKPSAELNANVTNGRFRYDRDFLMQFMHICKERPHAFTPLHELSIERVNQPPFPNARGGLPRHRSTSGAVSRLTTSQPVNLHIGISKMYDFRSTGSKLTNEAHFDLLPGDSSALTSSGYPQSLVVQIPSNGDPCGLIDKNKHTRTKRGVPQKALLFQRGQGSCFGASVPTDFSEADAKKEIDEDVKEFFVVRDLKEADVYLSNLPREYRFRLVETLVASALESKETDAMLVAEFFTRAASNGQCTLEVFEEGFTPIAELLDDIAIDAPKAFDYMAIMLKGAGFEKEPNRLQRIAWKLRAEDSNKLVLLTQSHKKHKAHVRSVSDSS